MEIRHLSNTQVEAEARADGIFVSDADMLLMHFPDGKTAAKAALQILNAAVAYDMNVQGQPGTTVETMIVDAYTSAAEALYDYDEYGSNDAEHDALVDVSGTLNWLAELLGIELPEYDEED